MKIDLSSHGRLFLAASLLAASLAMGCRHTADARRPDAGFAAPPVNPATNVIIVPASAAPRPTTPPPADMAPMADPRPTVIKDYDAALIQAIHRRWQALIATSKEPASKGQVVVDFQLKSNGTVHDVVTFSSTVDARLTALCQRAIRDVAPFPSWSPELTRQIGTGARPIRFTFDFTAQSPTRFP